MFDPRVLLLYAVTESGKPPDTLAADVEAALIGGATMVQLREKDADDAMLAAKIACLRPLCHRYGVPLIVNDRADLALTLGADGVHLGQSDASVASVRALAGPDFIIGATAKTVAQGQAARAAGADYLGIGALFPSPTKKNAIPVTKDALAAIIAASAMPAVAIGGITAENARTLAGCGIRGIAVVSSLFSVPDIAAAARALRAAACLAVGTP